MNDVDSTPPSQHAALVQDVELAGAYAVTQRTREIAVQVAFGATSRQRRANVGAADAG